MTDAEFRRLEAVMNEFFETEIKDVVARKWQQRGPRYFRLGFSTWEITYRKLVLDDQLWGMAKDLPISPDNPDKDDRIDGAFEEMKKAGMSVEEIVQNFKEEAEAYFSGRYFGEETSKS